MTKPTRHLSEKDVERLLDNDQLPADLRELFERSAEHRREAGRLLGISALAAAIARGEQPTVTDEATDEQRAERVWQRVLAATCGHWRKTGPLAKLLQVAIAHVRPISAISADGGQGPLQHDMRGATVDSIRRLTGMASQQHLVLFESAAAAVDGAAALMEVHRQAPPPMVSLHFGNAIISNGLDGETALVDGPAVDDVLQLTADLVRPEPRIIASKAFRTQLVHEGRAPTGRPIRPISTVLATTPRFEIDWRPDVESRTPLALAASAATIAKETALVEEYTGARGMYCALTHEQGVEIRPVFVRITPADQPETRAHVPHDIVMGRAVEEAIRGAFKALERLGFNTPERSVCDVDWWIETPEGPMRDYESHYRGPSVGLCAAIAAAASLTEANTPRHTVATGGIDGQAVVTVGDIEAKLDAAAAFGLQVFLVPNSDIDLAQAVESGGPRVVGVESIEQAIRHVLGPSLGLAAPAGPQQEIPQPLDLPFESGNPTGFELGLLVGEKRGRFDTDAGRQNVVVKAFDRFHVQLRYSRPSQARYALLLHGNAEGTWRYLDCQPLVDSEGAGSHELIVPDRNHEPFRFRWGEGLNRIVAILTDQQPYTDHLRQAASSLAELVSLVRTDKASPIVLEATAFVEPAQLTRDTRSGGASASRAASDAPVTTRAQLLERMGFRI